MQNMLVHLHSEYKLLSFVLRYFSRKESCNIAINIERVTFSNSVYVNTNYTYDIIECLLSIRYLNKAFSNTLANPDARF